MIIKAAETVMGAAEETVPVLGAAAGTGALVGDAVGLPLLETVTVTPGTLVTPGRLPT